MDSFNKGSFLHFEGQLIEGGTDTFIARHYIHPSTLHTHCTYTLHIQEIDLLPQCNSFPYWCHKQCVIGEMETCNETSVREGGEKGRKGREEREGGRRGREGEGEGGRGREERKGEEGEIWYPYRHLFSFATGISQASLYPPIA